MGVRVGSWAGCRHRERHPAGLPDVQIGTCTSRPSDPGPDRRPCTDSVVPDDPGGRLQEWGGTFGPLDTPGGGVGVVARRVLRLEGLPNIKPTRTTRDYDGRPRWWSNRLGACPHAPKADHPRALASSGDKPLPRGG